MRFFCIGDTRAKTWVRSATTPRAGSDISWIASPSTMSSDWSPTWRQISRVTRSLSPVMILTWIPSPRSARIVSATPSWGGSRNAANPTSTRSRSSAVV